MYGLFLLKKFYNSMQTVWTQIWVCTVGLPLSVRKTFDHYGNLFCLQDIYSQNPNVKWADIIGLDDSKRLSKEAVVYPIKVRKFSL